MTRQTRKKAREEALRREAWQLENHLSEAARDMFEDIRDALESCEGDLMQARSDILEILESGQKEAIHAATGPRRPVEHAPAKGERDNRITPAKQEWMREQIVRTYRRLTNGSPDDEFSLNACMDALRSERISAGQPIQSKPILRKAWGKNPWPPTE